MTISETEFERANRRGQDRRAKGPVATEAHFDALRGRVVIVLSSGLEVSFEPRLAEGLGQAAPQAERNRDQPLRARPALPAARCRSLPACPA